MTHASSPSLVDSPGSESEWITITLSHRKTSYTFELAGDASIPDLFEEIEATLDIPTANQKILGPKGLLLKASSKNDKMTLNELQGKTLTLLGCGAAEVAAVQNMSERVAQRNAARLAQKANLRRLKNTRRSAPGSQEDAKYTFLQVRPLEGLPRPERSQVLLMRLKEDPGIRAAMKKHKFTVSLLTEMEPLSHTQTTHEGTSRILGLNRNQGEVIELRLRTDAHDGYRDYKTIRKTLCHELAHNVHGPHDRQFWDLCHLIEREVDAADWKSGGHTIGESSRYTISGQARLVGDDEEDHEDDGGWTGGEFVLGGLRNEGAGMSRREILAQAALERQRKEDGAERKACDAAEKGWRPCQRPQQNPSEKRE
ncbi:ubiquitin/metalloprotease fusion protein [Moelleriella libera RCEF 2490]|uniref:Ubiquitin/metalloprotease fusion protein n=1 Tax=Moelleriella libera RCEF 2490 TaxID=1081109 RepID=A0A162K3D4_9HYPO|nr:ubiquitin/metalloprotease fusion protein [Moelleriella libera RCEF 2490]